MLRFQCTSCITNCTVVLHVLVLIINVTYMYIRLPHSRSSVLMASGLALTRRCDALRGAPTVRASQHSGGELVRTPPALARAGSTGGSSCAWVRVIWTVELSVRIDGAVGRSRVDRNITTGFSCAQTIEALHLPLGPSIAAEDGGTAAGIKGCEHTRPLMKHPYNWHRYMYWWWLGRCACTCS